MSALYNPAAYKGTDVILDMDYTDIGKRYRIILGKTESRVLEQFTEKPTTVIHKRIVGRKIYRLGRGGTTAPISDSNAVLYELPGGARVFASNCSIEGDSFENIEI